MKGPAGEELLKTLEETGAVQKGHFKLSSGRHSDTYIQCSRLLEEPRTAVEVGRALAEEARAMGDIDMVLCPALGAVIIGFTTALALGVPVIFAERVEGAMTLRRGFQVPTGSRILLVEDVITTGGSIMELAGLAEEAGAVVVGIACIIDRGGELDRRYPLVSLLRIQAVSHPPEECPLCREEIPLNSPGSRYLGSDA
jgi:orotate phosphoribosyltransferase